MLVGVIIACEVAFWVFLLGGLAARYLLRRRRLSSALLVAVPLVDVILLVVAAIDLATGGTPGTVHGLAAVYLGLSVTFGPSVVAATDVRFAHRFAGGPPPSRPQGRAEKVRHEWVTWLRCAGAALIAAAGAGAMHLVAPPGVDPLTLWGFPAQLGIVTAVWLAVGPLPATFTREHRTPAEQPAASAAGERNESR
ncbi:hypothetical protein EV383_5590 [Pseudonocardia sediminis]|uniref:Uncharacterized protein n=1 Tax=Pseudonocardia sediminis TaxID=1397368 RepID=A0A4Q7V2P5_PSEST|nr:hypothetical protein [Pseudonocardia sediminis]RZT88646.1 hypothetical protein EV383_5590 [Pseudonocardia sediminis]